MSLIRKDLGLQGKGSVVKSRKTGQLYELQYVVHPSENVPKGTTDVYACYKLSPTDGMPISSLIWLSLDELE